MFPAGSHFDIHWHTHDEYVVVVAGSVRLRPGDEDHDLTVGTYVVIPGKLNHSWTVPDGGDEVVILVRRAGPADFHFVED
jgi:quercetin dioxygenase-like cupin family protein